MLLKYLALFSVVSVALGYPVQDTPEDLKDFFQEIDSQVKTLLYWAMIQIRDNEIPLATYVDAAKLNIIDDMKTAATPYWEKIKSLEDEAADQGKNITDCINLGNQQLYVLNDTIVLNGYRDFESYGETGNAIITDSATEAYSVVEELIALKEVVNACNDDTCATELKKIATQYYARAKATLIDAETKASNYVLIYLPVLLASVGLDSDSYVAQYTVFLNDVTDCINQL